eukprot:6179105-Pleurochrysis_carterae.AAC.2
MQYSLRLLGAPRLRDNASDAASPSVLATHLGVTTATRSHCAALAGHTTVLLHSLDGSRVRLSPGPTTLLPAARTLAPPPTSRLLPPTPSTWAFPDDVPLRLASARRAPAPLYTTQFCFTHNQYNFT